MSAHLHVFIGPYVRIVAKPSPVPTAVRVCQNGACDKWHKPSSAKFCDECGQALTEASVSKMARKNLYEVLTGALANSFYEAGENMGDVTRLIPNHKGPRDFLVDTEADSETGLLGVKREEEVAWLEERYSAALAALRAAFPSVEVCWGALGYWS